MKKLLAVLVGVLVIAGVWFVFSRQAGGPKDSTPTPTISQPSGPGQASVILENFAFVPNNLVVAKGTTVTWTNRDSAQHSIVSDSGYATMNSPLFGKGEAFSVTFTEAGTYPYHCRIHPSMQARIIVQ